MPTDGANGHLTTTLAAIHLLQGGVLNRNVPIVLNDLDPHELFQRLIEAAVNPATDARSLLGLARSSDITGGWRNQPLWSRC